MLILETFSKVTPAPPLCTVDICQVYGLGHYLTFGLLKVSVDLYGL